MIEMATCATLTVTQVTPPPEECTVSDFTLASDEVFYCQDNPCLSDYCTKTGKLFKLVVSRTPISAEVYGDSPGTLTCDERVSGWQQGYELRYKQCSKTGKWYAVKYPATLTEVTKDPAKINPLAILGIAGAAALGALALSKKEKRT